MIFNGKFEGFMYPTASKCDQNDHFDQKRPFGTENAIMGSVDHIQILFKCYNN